MKTYNTGLCIMRAQPFHKGHERIINVMLEECRESYLLLGSIQESRSERNPFTYEERRQMVQNIFYKEVSAGILKVQGIADIDDFDGWVDYVVAQLGFKPEAYYCGSKEDAACYLNKGFDIHIIGRDDVYYHKISSTAIRMSCNNGADDWLQYIDERNQPIVLKQLCNNKRR